MQRRSQEERARSTRDALVAAARELFTAKGYAAVPADEIVAAAGLTRGAMYHHYADKQALFRDVFEQVEIDLTAELRAGINPDADIWTNTLQSLRQFLDICERPEVQQIGLTDAPAVLGWEQWRAIETEHGLGLVLAQLNAAAAAGQLVDVDIQALAHIVLSAVIEAALLIAHAANHAAARAMAEHILITLLAGVIKQPG
jgi:AcrR family transcriptional regulator